MKKFLYIVGALVGGFLLYKLFSSFAGSSSGRPGTSAGGTNGGTTRVSSNFTTPASSRSVAPDNTGSLISAGAGALSTLAGGISKLFSSNSSTPSAGPFVTSQGVPGVNFGQDVPGGLIVPQDAPVQSVDIPSESFDVPDPSFDPSFDTSF